MRNRSDKDEISRILDGEVAHRWAEIILWIILLIGCLATLYSWER